MDLEDLYQDLLMDHFKNPRCKGCLGEPDSACTMHNPLCGDNINLTISIGKGQKTDQKIDDIAFDGSGCSISQASASLMAELVKGKSLDEIKKYLTLFRQMMKEEVPELDLKELGDVAALGGVRKFSARIRCALLAWEALDRCVKEVSKKEVPS